jgi:omega-6 fatty acid desaturase (delta-12 desaturase)
VETASPARPTVREVRGRIPAEVSARSVALGLTAFLAAMALYCAAVAAVLLAPWWPLQIAGAVLAGAFVATCFVVGHDACHGSLTPYDLLNKVLGRIAFLPSWTPYVSWEFAHNRVHHSYTNLRGRDYAWAPLSRQDYDSLSPPRRWLERHYRSLWGLGSYYLIEYWLRHLMLPARQERREMKRPLTFVLDLGLVLTFAAAQTWGLYVWCQTLGPSEGFWGPFTSVPALMLTVIVLPYLVWNWAMGFAIFQHHNHPRAVWHADREQWDFFASQVESTVHAQMPGWIEWLSAFIMQHTAHHANGRIPLYRLAESQRLLERAYGEAIIIEPWSWTALGKTLARCQLYDYENHRWLNFAGRPTTAPHPVMRELQELGARRGKPRNPKSAERYAATPTNAGSTAGQTQPSQ